MEGDKFPREITLCLSGGAAKGAFELGVLSVLEEHGVTIKAISGVSIGAVIGASLACGNSAKKTYEILSSKEYKKIFKFRPKNGILFDIDTQSAIIKKLLPKQNFDELTIPLHIAVTDLLHARVVYMTSGDLHKSVLASSAISPLFAPVVIDGVYYSDGGIIDNFPVQELQQYEYPIVGINLYPNLKTLPRSFMSWVKKNIFLAWHSHNLEKNALCDYCFSSPKLSELKTFGFRDVQKGYDLGVEEAKRYLH